MSTSKKLLGKRKRKTPSPSTTSQISRRLEKLRGAQRNLWDGDDDNVEKETEEYVQSKISTKPIIDNTYILVTDSDDEKTSSRKRSKSSNKSKKKSSRNQDENLSSDNDHKMTSKCATCLICSILSTLTSYNCCPKHLSILIHNKNSHDHHHQKNAINLDQWPTKQVMILPVTDELIQRCLNPQELYRLKTRTSTSPVHKKTTESKRSTRKLSKKSTMTSESSDIEHTNVTKKKSTIKSTQMETEQISSSSSMIDSSLSSSGTIPPDVTYTVITSTSTTINSFESPNMLDTCQLQQSSDQPIVIDDSPSDAQQDNLVTNNTQKKTQNDPWTPISDATYAAIETALEQVDRNSQEQMEFTPAIARRTPTELMASRLPKIQLKKGRYHRGKPITENNVPDTTTNESRSTIISQSSSSASSSSSLTTASVITINNRPTPSLATIIEDESLVIQPTRQNSEKSSQSCQILSNRHNDTRECLSDTVMSGLLAQDELSQHDTNHTKTKTVSNEVAVPPPPAIVTEDCSLQNDSNKSVDISQSSQLTNDQNDTQPFISSTTNEKSTTPARKSYRLNPDGSRISMSRQSLSGNHQSSIVSSRRTSTDVTQTISHTNK